MFFVSLAAAWALSLAFHPALKLAPRGRLMPGAALACAIAAVPFLVPADAPLARFASAIFAGVVAMKLWDLHLGAERDHRPSLTEMMAFMATPTTLVHRRTGFESQPGGWLNLRRLVVGLGVGVASYWVLYRLIAVDWSGVPFLVEHAAKATVFFVFATAFFEVLVALVRLAGGYSPDVLDRPLTARTPAEFWRRYNRCVGEFLREDVFRAAGGLRHPLRATVIAFLVSGLLHEYIFWVATGSVTGYQTAFFLLQGAAVALTIRARPGLVVGVVGTFAFNVLTSVFFFASIHQMGGLYSGKLPWWMWGG